MTCGRPYFYLRHNDMSMRNLTTFMNLLLLIGKWQEMTLPVSSLRQVRKYNIFIILDISPSL